MSPPVPLMPLSSLLSALGDHSESELWLPAPARAPAGSRAAALQPQRLHLFLQGDDSLSAITFDSDTETVSEIVLPPLTFRLTHVTPRCAVGRPLQCCAWS